MSEAFGLVISEIRRETADAVTIVFDDPDDLVGGTSGQHVVVRVEIDGKEYRRVFSLSSSPELGLQPAITVKRLVGGVVSPILVDSTEVGETMLVEPAAGVFCVDIGTQNQRTYYAFMAGSGGVPIMSMARTILEREPKSRVHIAYGNRRIEDVDVPRGARRSGCRSPWAAHRDARDERRR